jgi:hypothetical protein
MKSYDTFEIQVKKERNKHYLSITQNGYQWGSLGFDSEDQLRQVANTIQNYLIGITQNKMGGLK